ncbi:MAG: hypothetical protein OES57_00715 [Acidimicrobiia bacterium]|nr:hypothetical protein [Acidimicrobiia bacterium]
MTTAQVREPQGQGWIIFSSIMLMLAGLKLFFDGLWALDRSDTVVEELFYETDLGTWGWIWLITGIVVFAGGIAILSRAQWARWVGIIGASIAIVANFFWLFWQPVGALIGILLASLVLYGLLVYGDDEPVY